MIAVPCNGIADDLPVYPGIVTELRLRSPLFKVEEIREELECAVLIQRAQPQQTAEMTFKNRGGFLKLHQHPRGVGGVLLRLTLECLQLRWLQREAPVKVYASKARFRLKEVQPVIDEYLCDGTAVLLLTRQLETGHDAGVLIQAGTFRKAAQCGLYR